MKSVNECYGLVNNSWRTSMESLVKSTSETLAHLPKNHA